MSRRFDRVHTYKMQPDTFNGEPVAPEYETHIEEQRVYAGGCVRWSSLLCISRAKTRTQAVKDAKALLRQWARELK
jgi:hypothetical protein